MQLSFPGHWRATEWPASPLTWISCKYPDKAETAVSDHWPARPCHESWWSSVWHQLRPVMTDREIRDSQEPDLADSWSSVKSNLARGEFCWHHKNRRQTGAKMVNTKSLARLKALLESFELLWPGKRRSISCCKSSIISHGATSQRKTVRLRKIRG